MKYLRRIYLFITKFCYYGYHGTKCWDFDAGCIHSLIYAHMKRVNKFMNSDQTHLVWNDSDTKGMRRLAEFTELSRRMAKNDLKNYAFYGKVKEKYPDMNPLDAFNGEHETYKREVRRAFEKDRAVCEQLTKRYYYLLEKDVPGFWD